MTLQEERMFRNSSKIFKSSHSSKNISLIFQLKGYEGGMHNHIRFAKCINRMLTFLEHIQYKMQTFQWRLTHNTVKTAYKAYDILYTFGTKILILKPIYEYLYCKFVQNQTERQEKKREVDNYNSGVQSNHFGQICGNNIGENWDPNFFHFHNCMFFLAKNVHFGRKKRTTTSKANLFERNDNERSMTDK